MIVVGVIRAVIDIAADRIGVCIVVRVVWAGITDVADAVGV